MTKQPPTIEKIVLVRGWDTYRGETFYQDAASAAGLLKVMEKVNEIIEVVNKLSENKQ